MTSLFWLWVGGALGQAALMAWHDGASIGVRRNYHRGGWPTLVGQILALACWPVLSLVFVIFGRALQRRLDQLEGVKVFPVRCEVCGLVDEFRVVRGNWLQDSPYWYGFLKDGGITVCSTECVKHWEQQHRSTEIPK